VLVQTLAPGARPIVHAARHDSGAFTAEELERRRVLGYPPFGSLIRIVCAAAEQPGAHSVTAELRAAIAPSSATVLGPAPLFKLRGKARSQLLIKTAERSAAVAAVREAVYGASRAAARRGVSISVDVDPQ
jgi:primosomal protein N' (replication factor Y)